MKAFLIFSMSIAVFLAFSTAVQAEVLSSPLKSSGDIEVSCKIKAKEEAAKAYRGCVTDEKNVQIEQIKRSYQVKMLAIKKYYEGQLKQVGGTASAKVEKAEAPVTSEPAVEKVEETQPAAIEDSAAAVPSPEIEKSEIAPVEAPAFSDDSMVAEQAPAQTTEDSIAEEMKAELRAEPVVESTPIVAAPKAPKSNPAKIVLKKQAVAPVKKSSKVQKLVGPKKARKVVASNIKSSLPAKKSFSASPKKAPLSDDSMMDIPEPIPVSVKPSDI